jgi:hypothetical protein
VAAHAQLAPSLYVVNFDLDELHAESRRRLAGRLAARDEANAIEEERSDARGEYLMSGHDLHLAAMARRSPALAALIYWPHEHASGEYYDAVATCCTPMTGYHL